MIIIDRLFFEEKKHQIMILSTTKSKKIILDFQSKQNAYNHVTIATERERIFSHHQITLTYTANTINNNKHLTI